MAFFSMFRRSNSDVSSKNSSSVNSNDNPKRQRCLRRDSNDDSIPFFEIISDMRIATIFLNVFNISMILVLVVTGIGIWEDEWKHWLISCCLSMVGTIGALRVNLFLTYVSTIGFAILALFYGMMAYTIGVIVSCFIVVSQILLIREMMEGIVTEHDDALLASEGQEVIKAAASFAV
jgi:hypothetical protein